MTNGTTTTHTGEISKLDELRARKAKREEEARKAAERLEEEELLLEEKLIEKHKGARGVAFEIVVTDVGIFAVKPPDYVVAKQFNSLDKKSDEDVAKFVRPCVIEPSADAFVATIVNNGGVAWRLANAALALYEASASKRVGKF